MTHLWIRAEQRPNERRVGVTPKGAKQLMANGIQVTVENSPTRIIPTQDYAQVGCDIAEYGSWTTAPAETIIFGLKELPDDGRPLRHRHIMFGHAFKGQHSGQSLLARFRKGQGTLYDLEYLVDEQGRRVAAFGYWAGYAGAAVTLRAWFAKLAGETCAPMSDFDSKNLMLSELHSMLSQQKIAPPTAIVIGALGRVGAGAIDLCTEMGMSVTRWDMAETASGGPFLQILNHDIFLNCILARPDTPVFVPVSALETPHRLAVIGDIACDPDSDYNPVPLYDAATSWAKPVVQSTGPYPVDIVAIDNLPSLLPLESSYDYAAQLLPTLMQLDAIDTGVWGRAKETFEKHVKL